jgi:hypothetical protein
VPKAGRTGPVRESYPGRPSNSRSGQVSNAALGADRATPAYRDAERLEAVTEPRTATIEWPLRLATGAKPVEQPPSTGVQGVQAVAVQTIPVAQKTPGVQIVWLWCEPAFVVAVWSMVHCPAELHSPIVEESCTGAPSPCWSALCVIWKTSPVLVRWVEQHRGSMDWFCGPPPVNP